MNNVEEHSFTKRKMNIHYHGAIFEEEAMLRGSEITPKRFPL